MAQDIRIEDTEKPGVALVYLDGKLVAQVVTNPTGDKIEVFSGGDQDNPSRWLVGQATHDGRGDWRVQIGDQPILPTIYPLSDPAIEAVVRGYTGERGLTYSAGA